MRFWRCYLGYLLSSVCFKVTDPYFNVGIFFSLDSFFFFGYCFIVTHFPLGIFFMTCLLHVWTLCCLQFAKIEKLSTLCFCNIF